MSLAIAAAALLLFRSPFPISLRVALLFGYYSSYECAVIARSYILDVLLLFSLACLKDPTSSPLAFGVLLALLANANVHGLILAVVLLAGLLDRLPAATRILAAGGVGAAILQLWPPLDGQLTSSVIGLRWRLGLDALSRGFFPLDAGPERIVAAAVTAAIVVWYVRSSLMALLVVILGGALRYDGLLWLWLIFVLGLVGEDGVATRRSERRFVYAAVGVVALLSCLAATRVWLLEWSLPFSEGKDMARYLAANNLASEPIAAHPAPLASSMLAYLPRRTFWYPGIEENGSFMKWNAAYLEGLDVSLPEAVRRVRRQSLGGALPFLLTCEPLGDARLSGYALAWATPGRAFGKPEERYYLYRPVSGEPPVR